MYLLTNLLFFFFDVVYLLEHNLTDFVFFYVSAMKYYLHMDGRGNYEFKPITEETVEFGS